GGAAARARVRGEVRPPAGRSLPARRHPPSLAPGQAPRGLPLRPARDDRTVRARQGSRFPMIHCFEDWGNLGTDPISNLKWGLSLNRLNAFAVVGWPGGVAQVLLFGECKERLERERFCVDAGMAVAEFGVALRHVGEGEIGRLAGVELLPG